MELSEWLGVAQVVMFALQAVIVPMMTRAVRALRDIRSEFAEQNARLDKLDQWFKAHTHEDVERFNVINQRLSQIGQAGYVARDELENLVSYRNPYYQDRQLVQQSIAAHTRNIEQIMTVLGEVQQRLVRIEVRVDRVLSRSQ